MAVVCIAMMLTACVQPAAKTGQSRQGVDFAPDANGLAVLPSAQRVDFGRSPKGVIPALTRELGKPKVLGLTGCPPTITRRMQWNDLELTFTQERFVGWTQGAATAGTTCNSIS